MRRGSAYPDQGRGPVAGSSGLQAPGPPGSAGDGRAAGSPGAYPAGQWRRLAGRCLRDRQTIILDSGFLQNSVMPGLHGPGREHPAPGPAGARMGRGGPGYAAVVTDMPAPARVRTAEELYGDEPAFAGYEAFEAALDHSLAPRGSGLLFDLVAGLGLPPGCAATWRVPNRTAAST